MLFSCYQVIGLQQVTRDERNYILKVSGLETNAETMTSSKKCFTLAGILDLLEEDDDNVQDIFMEPPTVSELTDEDLDEGDGNINSLSKNQLMAPAEKKEIRKENATISDQSNKRKRARKSKKGEIVWRSGGITKQPDQFPFIVNDNIGEMTAVQYFELFFDDTLVELIIAASTEYSLSKNWPDIKLSKEELRTFFAILIVSGYNELPGRAMYWSTGDDLRNTAVYEAMRRVRFDNIMKSLHFQSNLSLDKFDKFSKLRPLISHLQKKFMENYVPTAAISHDEAMVQYFGKHGCKQAIRNKPIRFGYKIWCQNSPSGYLIAFNPYQGKTYQGDEEMENKFGKCASTVLHLLDQYPLSKSEFPYHIYCDNLFTTFPLLKELKDRGYNCTGTIRTNRLGNECCLLNTKQFEKKERGHTEIATVKFNESEFFLTRWKDNSVVSLASTCLAADPEGIVKRWSKADTKHIFVSIPHSIQNYNQNMGGTDRMDQNVNAYRISIRGKKWWWPLFTWMLDVSVQNAWLLARAQSNDTKLTQLSFRRDLAMSYLLQQKNPPKTAGRKPKNPAGAKVARFDKIEHFVRKTSNNKQRRCAGSSCNSTVRTECSKCNVGLCIACFQLYHTN